MINNAIATLLQVRDFK